MAKANINFEDNRVEVVGIVTEVEGSYVEINTHPGTVVTYLTNFWGVSRGDKIKVTGYITQRHLDADIFYGTKVEVLYSKDKAYEKE